MGGQIRRGRIWYFRGAPIFSPEVQNTYFQRFGDLWTENRDAPKTPNSTTTITHKKITELIPKQFRFGNSSTQITKYNSQNNSVRDSVILCSHFLPRPCNSRNKIRFGNHRAGIAENNSKIIKSGSVIVLCVMANAEIIETSQKELLPVTASAKKGRCNCIANKFIRHCV